MDHRILPLVGSLSYSSQSAVQLEMVKRTTYAGLLCRLSGVVNVTVSGALVAEGVQNLIQKISIKDGDTEITGTDGRGLWQLNKMLLGNAPGVLTEPDTAGSTGNLNFAMDFLFPFGHLKSGDEMKTWLDLSKLANPVLEVNWGAASHLTAATASISSATIKVIGDEIKGTAETLLGYPFERFLVHGKTETLTGAVSGHVIRLLRSNLMRGVLLRVQDGSAALSNSILSNLLVRERTEEPIIQGTWSDLQAYNRLFHLRGVAPDTGWVFLDFLKTGRQDMRDPRGLDAFDLVVDASAAGAVQVYHVMESRRFVR